LTEHASGGIYAVSADKLQNADEFAQWYREGRTYQWIIDKYLEKYDIKISSGTISNWRVRLDLTDTRRITRNRDLIPWAVKREHRHLLPAEMLRMEARRREGREMREGMVERLDEWLEWLNETNAVVHYDPDTEPGWWYVPRERRDKDIIRRPPRATATKVRGREEPT
jgi:hypothetical protein